MNFIHLEPNQPQSFIFPSTGPFKLPGEYGSLYPLPDGSWLHLGPPQAASLADLKLLPGEEFAVCPYQRAGAILEWQVWLTPSTEKVRAAAEVRELDLEAQLGASLKLVSRERKGKPGEGGTETYLAPTGTEGRTASALPLPDRKQAALAVASGRRRGGSGQIPANIAVAEVIGFVTKGLKDAGEQWSDESRQGLVSTVLIAAFKSNLIGLWERDGEAA